MGTANALLVAAIYSVTELNLASCPSEKRAHSSFALVVELERRVRALDGILVSLVKVLGQYDVAVLADSLQTGLLANGRNVGRADLLGAVHVVLEVDLISEVHLGRARLVDEALLSPVGQRELDLSVEAARPQQRRVQRVCAVGRHDDLDVRGLVESVHLVEQLKQDALHLSVGARLSVESLRGDGVDLVDEDDGGRVLLGEAEDVAHHARALAQILLHELGADDADEGGRGGVGDGLGEHGLARPGRAVEQHAARRVDADLLVEVEVRERELDGLAHLLLLDVHAADVLVADVGALRHLHHLDARVGLWREHVHDGVRVAVQRDGRVGLEALAIESAEDAHVVVGAGRGADDAVVGVHHLEELADHERHRLDALDLLLGTDELPLQVLHLVLDVALLDVQELQVALQRLELAVQVRLALLRAPRASERAQKPPAGQAQRGRTHNQHGHQRLLLHGRGRQADLLHRGSSARGSGRRSWALDPRFRGTQSRYLITRGKFIYFLIRRTGN